MADAPPQPCDDGSPFQTKVHTPHAVLCGDFNAVASDAAIAAIVSTSSATGAGHGFRDAWPLVHGGAPHAPTFRLFDHHLWRRPDGVRLRVRQRGLGPRRCATSQVDLQTRASDHQPVMVELDDTALRRPKARSRCRRLHSAVKPEALIGASQRL